MGLSIVEAHAVIVIGSTANKGASANGSLHKGMSCHSSATTSYDLGLYQGVRIQSGAGCHSVQEQTVVEGNVRDL